MILLRAGAISLLLVSVSAALAPLPCQVPPAPMAAPSAADLGVPLYPGARFDGQMSASMSGMGDNANYYVYTSADAPALVTSFYESKTGKKGTTNEAGTLIAVVGEGLFPDLGITIQPNPGSYPPEVKSIITVRKKK